MEIKVSVRNLVEFILRSGDIDNRRAAISDNAMAEGSRIHRMIQRRMGADYHAEVVLRYAFEDEKCTILVEGRADGIIIDSKDTSKVTVDEIKGTYRDLWKMKEPVGVHLAQAKCYAFIYASQNDLEKIKVRMTYCQIDTEEIRYFEEEYAFSYLKEWFMEVLLQYKKWADFESDWKELRKKSIKEVEFPFPYREGQKDLVTYVYRTIYHKRKLFIEAPTGVGKTISTVFPSVKAVGEGMGDKIFYLTAKTITRTVADEAFSHLREQGLKFKTVILTAKEKICFMDEAQCNPEYCPYAKGHYDRINDAMFELLVNEDSFNREKIEDYAMKHQVCPFEMCLDMSLFSDAVIGDYNYVFDPHVYLRRFFAEGVQGDYLFLIDEAHNLVDRGREMYSAVLVKEDFLALKKVVKLVAPKMEKQLEKCNKELLALKRECENYKIVEYIAPFVMALNRLVSTIEQFLEEHEESSPIKEEILEFYFQVTHFLDIYERLDENYVTYTENRSDGSFMLKLFCMNPKNNLAECMARARSSILFSATFLPIQYYKNLLGGTAEDYEAYAKSVFDEEKRALYIGSDVTSKYTRRSELEYRNIAAYIHEIIRNRHGNYMVFLPSHAFLNAVYEAYMNYFCDETQTECLVQDDYMNEKEREEFLNRFRANEGGNENTESIILEQIIQMDIEYDEEKTLLGFCVMGGIFSEGIDLKNDSLIGAIIVGTGLPQVCNEREILKDFFQNMGENGFDYAYRYPGMNKVLQAAGRVIRTAEDVGIVALLDERFLEPAYQKMFPREWEHFEVLGINQIAKRVEKFWNDWL
ncbi:MAG: ATP-dependent DNA helicase [Lachnospiraceae bacterium]|nr:ATP-dependent DNA helicase [Lachnospiraceae bacterium]